MASGSLAVTYTFVNDTVADGPQVSQNNTDIVNYINNRNDGTDEWQALKVTSTDTSPVNIVSSAATTNVILNNTATDGDVLISFQLSGTTQFSMGVDDGDSDAFKIGSTAIGTNTALQIPTGGSQVNVAAGSATTPGLGFIGRSGTGLYSDTSNIVTVAANGAQCARFSETNFQIKDGTEANPGLLFIDDPDTGIRRVGANEMALVSAGADIMSVLGNRIEPSDDNSYSNGTASKRWSDLRSVLINGADYGFMNGWFIREWPATFDDVQTKKEDWFKANANKGLQIVNDIGELVMVIGRDGTVYANGMKKIDEAKEMK